MRKTAIHYDRFPTGTVLVRATVVLTLLIVGTALVVLSNGMLGLGYAAYVIALFSYIMNTACVRCDYYGSICDSGLSMLTSLLFSRKPDRNGFSCVAKRTVLPLLVLLAVPIVAFAVSSFSGLSVLSIVLMAVYLIAIALLVLTNRRLACPHCRMNDICPLGKSTRN